MSTSAPKNTSKSTTSMSLEEQRDHFGGELAGYIESVTSSITFRYDGIPMVITSELSDAQEMLYVGQVKGALQTVNRARHLISEFDYGLPGSGESARIAGIATRAQETTSGAAGTSPNAREVAMLGLTRDSYLARLAQNGDLQKKGLGGFLDGELARAQQMMMAGQSEEGRQLLNCVKMLIIDARAPRREAVVDNDDAAAPETSVARRTRP